MVAFVGRWPLFRGGRQLRFDCTHKNSEIELESERKEKSEIKRKRDSETEKEKEIQTKGQK